MAQHTLVSLINLPSHDRMATADIPGLRLLLYRIIPTAISQALLLHQLPDDWADLSRSSPTSMTVATKDTRAEPSGVSSRHVSCRTRR
jgi:hypothetical protein